MAANGNEHVVEGEVVQTAIVPTPEPQTLGPIGVRDPHAMVREASEMAKALADIINSQKLFAIIQGKKYVLCEGWTTLGAMLGIVTVEEYVKEISNGFEARVRLIAARDGRLVGGASAICTYDEPTWKSRSPYALRSMALTRATSKAFRLAYAWIMKLAGYEATPAEEMIGTEKQDWEEGAKAAKAVLDRKAKEDSAVNAEVEGKGATPTGAVALKQVHFDTRGEWTYLTGDGLGTLLHFLGLPAEEGGIYQFKEKFMAADKDEQGFPIDWRVKSNKAELLAEAAVSYGLDAKQVSLTDQLTKSIAKSSGTALVERAIGPSTTGAPETARAPRRSEGGATSTDVRPQQPKRAILAEGHLAGALDGADLTKLKQKAGQYLKVRVGEYEASLFDNFELDLDGRKVRAFVELPNSLHQPVEFLVKPNGQYLNVVRILRLGCFEFDTDGMPIIRREPAHSTITDEELGI